MRSRFSAICLASAFFVAVVAPLVGAGTTTLSTTPQAGEARPIVPGDDAVRGDYLQAHAATFRVVERGTQNELGTVRVELIATADGDTDGWRFRLEMEGSAPDAAGVLGPHLRAPVLPLAVQSEVERQTLLSSRVGLESAGRTRWLAADDSSFSLVYYLVAAALPLGEGVAFAVPQPEGEAVFRVGARETIEIEGFGDVDVWPIDYSARGSEQVIGRFWLGDEPPYLMHAHMGEVTHWALESFELLSPGLR